MVVAVRQELLVKQLFVKELQHVLAAVAQADEVQPNILARDLQNDVLKDSVDASLQRFVPCMPRV